MTNRPSHLKLANLLRTIAEGEKSTEIARQVLAERTKFEPFSVFTRLDRNADGYLSLCELSDFFFENSIEVTQKDLKNFVMSYNPGSQERLSYSDFLNLVLPRNDPRLRDSCVQRNTFNVNEDEVLSYELELALARALHREVELAKKLEILKEDLVLDPDFKLSEIFELLDRKKRGEIDAKSLYSFFKKHCMLFITELDIYGILKRTDSDRDGLINYNEFLRIVLPIKSYLRHLDEKTVLKQYSERALIQYSSSKKSALKSRPEHGKYIALSPLASSTASHISSTRSLQTEPSQSTYSKYEEKNPLRMSYKKEERMSYDRKSMNGTPSFNAKEYEKHSIVIPDSIRYSDSNRSRPSESNGGLIRSNKTSESKRYPTSESERDDEKKLVYTLQKQSNMDQDLEAWKNRLALQKDFNLFDGFRLIDIKERGFVGKTELKNGLISLGINASKEEIDLLVARFDKDQVGIFTYGDFCNVMVPTEKVSAKIMTSRTPTYKLPQDLWKRMSGETKELYKRTWQAILSNEIYSENLRQKLNNKPLYKVWDAFQKSEIYGEEIADIDSFRDLLNRNRVYPSEKQLVDLVNKYDKDYDGAVSYRDFEREVSPRSPRGRGYGY